MLLIAIWRGKPKVLVTLHSDQGGHFTSHQWLVFLKNHKLVAQHEPSWQRPRQSRGRELLSVHQARTDLPPDLPNQAAGSQ
ncbi:hypothetical protein [Aquabacterium sp.]|uniref:hypothetical protein n=1 Tax=Aquabacterium sp. TaxID=1872578 RepID=UPI003BAF6306